MISYLHDFVIYIRLNNYNVLIYIYTAIKGKTNTEKIFIQKCIFKKITTCIDFLKIM